MHQQSQNVTVDATPEKVWKVVADENRLGEWSDGWRRHNFPWTKRNKVLECNKEPAYCLKWRTGGRLSFWSWRKWELKLTPDGTGTKITEKSTGTKPDVGTTLSADLGRLKNIFEPPKRPHFSNTGDKLTLLNVYTTQFGSYTTMLWQVPALGLTAQAFLMTIALGSPISDDARIAASALSIIIAWASQRLMHSQRGRAINQAELARRVSSELSLKQFLGGDFALEDAEPKRTNAQDVWQVDHRIYAMWKICMLIFGAINTVVIISVLWGFNLFLTSSK